MMLAREIEIEAADDHPVQSLSYQAAVTAAMVRPRARSRTGRPWCLLVELPASARRRDTGDGGRV